MLKDMFIENGHVDLYILAYQDKDPEAQASITGADTKQFVRLCTFDEYRSLVWTERYNGYGDFELETSVSGTNLTYLKEGNYIWSPSLDATMIIEDVNVVSDVVDGAKMIITGRSLESLLDRRIVARKRIYAIDEDKNEPPISVEKVIYTLLNDNVINPIKPGTKDVDENRKFLCFNYNKPKNNSPIYEKDESGHFKYGITSGEFYGDNLYDIIYDLCETFSIGFKMELDIQNSVINFEYSIGENRSYNQDESKSLKPYVIFSPKYNNLINSESYYSKTDYKNTCYISGNPDTLSSSNKKKYGTGYILDIYRDKNNIPKGFDRRETFYDNESKSNEETVYENDEPVTITLTKKQYENLIKYDGYEELSKHEIVLTFDGESDSMSTQFVYGKDYFLGDVVQSENEYGQTYCSRVTEYIRSYDINGIKEYPTFTVLGE